MRLALVVLIVSLGIPTVRAEDWQAAAVKKFPALGVPGSDFNTRFLSSVETMKTTEPGFFANADWPVRLAARIATEIEARPRINVESLIVKRVQVPGLLFGKNTLFRYFFAVRNDGAERFEGKATVQLRSAVGLNPTTETFDVGALEPGLSRVGYVDAHTGLPSSHGEYGITGFTFKITRGSDVLNEGAGKIASKFENLAP